MYSLLLHTKGLEMTCNLFKMSTAYIDSLQYLILFATERHEFLGKITHSKSREGIVPSVLGKFLGITESKEVIINTEIMSSFQEPIG